MMRLFVAALRCEILKARRSKVPLLTGAGFSLAPLMAGLFMFILKDPARARTLGLIGAKAQITTGVADWPTFLGVIAQATAVGGYVLFALVTAWVFGREFADRTLKLVLAIPTPRHAILAAKFLVVAIWSALLCAWVFAVALVVGLLIGLPGGSGPVVWSGVLHVAATGLLVTLLMSPIALLASLGRGYLAPLGFAILTIFLAQILAAIGWGAWFPWSVPALFSGLAGPRAELLGGPSYILVAVTSLAGAVATFAWWHVADHTG